MKGFSTLKGFKEVFGLSMFRVDLNIEFCQVRKIDTKYILLKLKCLLANDTIIFLFANGKQTFEKKTLNEAIEIIENGLKTNKNSWIINNNTNK